MTSFPVARHNTGTPCRGRRRILFILVLPITTVLYFLAPAVAQAEISYRVDFPTIDDSDLDRAIRDVMQLYALQDRRPLSITALRRRARQDVERIDAVLRAFGYYAAAVDVEVESTGDQEAVVTVTIGTGQAYTLTNFEIEYEPPLPASTPAPGREAIGLETGVPARSQDILDVGRKALARLARHGHPFASQADREVVVDHAAEAVRVRLVIDPGPPLRFGEVSVVGLTDVEEEVVRRQIEWQRGEVFDIRKVDETRRDLTGTRLFSSVRIGYDRPATTADAPAEIPITIVVEEGDHRTIGAGIRFATDTGLSANAFWEHRNLFSGAGAFRIDGEVGEQIRSAGVSYEKRSFARKDQTLRASLRAEEEDVNAYNASRIGSVVSLSRPWREHNVVSIGVSGELSRVEANEDVTGDADNYSLLGLPVSFRRDTSDNPLNPTRGMRLLATATPYIDFITTPTQFLTLHATDNHYFALDGERRYIIAVRGSAGVILGEERTRIPADKRLYAGGSETQRGYAFQLAGPLNDSNQPEGGRSALTGTIELRTRFYEDFGGVAFIDAGNAFEGPIPDFEDGVLFSAGVGIRYFTPIGPLRLDVAIPLRRRDADDAFQVYVSLGQAF